VSSSTPTILKDTAILILFAVLPSFQRVFTMRKSHKRKHPRSKDPEHKNYKTAPFEENARTWQRVQHKWQWQKVIRPNAQPASDKYSPWGISFQRYLAELCRRDYDDSDTGRRGFADWDSGYGSAASGGLGSKVRERD
jgi:hypothetical protein